MSEVQEGRVEFHLDGHLAPKDLSAEDFGAFVTEFEKLINARTEDLNLRDTILNVKTSVVGIHDGSVIADLAPSPKSSVLPIVVTTMSDIVAGRTEGWSIRSRGIYFNLLTRADRLGIKIRLRANNEGQISEAAIARIVAPPQLFQLKGTTTLYGEVVQLGGKAPKVDIQPIGYSRTVHADATREIVKDLENNGRLYQLVALTGEATWDPVTYEITSFTVDRWNTFAPPGAATAMQEMRAKYGKHFDAIHDVGAWLTELRGEGIE